MTNIEETKNAVLLVKETLEAIEKDKKEIEKIKKERLDWGYDSLCFRFEQIVNELIYCKARTPEAKEVGHYMDFEYYKRKYDRNKFRFYQVLDEVLGSIHNDKPNL